MQTQATLNLSKGFGQCGEVLNHKSDLFPAGEIYIKIDVPRGVDSVRINSRCNNSASFMRIAMAVDSLQRQGVDDIELFIPYLPYSRQDRVCANGESFSLKVLCRMLADLNLTRIITYDIHSNVAPVLLDNLINYDNSREVMDFIDYLDLSAINIALICPDIGAVKKTQWLIQKHRGLFKTAIYGQKVREEGTGKITISPIKEDLSGCVALVVDDICDGGATFVEIGKALHEAHVDQSYLFISHGVFSKGLGELKKYYKKIGTTNSIQEKDSCPMGVKYFNLDY